MNIKKLIKKIPGIKYTKNYLEFQHEYNYDRKFYLRNFSKSKETRNKIGYNMLLISHSLEKGMSNKNPRRFGVEKIKGLIDLATKYSTYQDADGDFAFINAINILRSYASFYKDHEWTNSEEYKITEKFVDKFKHVQKIDIGSFILDKKDFEKDSKIDYAKFLKSRHSVREFLPKRVSDKDMETAAKIALLSPSACNRQMCKIYYVSSIEKSTATIKAGQGFGGFEKNTINPVVITFDVNANYFIGERNQGWFNAGLLAMNLVNALHSKGIGSCFCQFGNTTKEEDKLKKKLGIPKNERIAVILATGYYCEKSKIPYSPRKNIEDIYKKI